jgi:predicted NAD/FAD-binding protein
LWRSVIGGAQAYVKTLIAPFAQHIKTHTAITDVARSSHGVTLTDQYGHTHHFDEVVFATHADVTLKLLGDGATDAEKQHLAAFGYVPNRVVLHTDQNLMPRRKAAWSSWNYLGQSRGASDRALCVTYWMNRLQVLGAPENYFVTLNPIKDIAPEQVIKEVIFSHPLFDHKALLAQKQLSSLQGQNHSWLCGAYFGAGFHEDALQSGLAVAEAISGIARPWAFDWSKSRIAYNPWTDEAVHRTVLA